MIFCLSERSLDLVLTLNGSLQPGIIFSCVSGLHLGQLRPNNVVDFTLQLLPLQTGLQVVGFLILKMILLGRKFPVSKIIFLMQIIAIFFSRFLGFA